MTTSVAYPYAKVKHGTGTKLAFLTEYIPDTNDFKGVCYKGYWARVLKSLTPTRYKTIRKFKQEDIIERWRSMPSINAYKKAKA